MANSAQGAGQSCQLSNPEFSPGSRASSYSRPRTSSSGPRELALAPLRPRGTRTEILCSPRDNPITKPKTSTVTGAAGPTTSPGGRDRRPGRRPETTAGTRRSGGPPRGFRRELTLRRSRTAGRAVKPARRRSMTTRAYPSGGLPATNLRFAAGATTHRGSPKDAIFGRGRSG